MDIAVIIGLLGGVGLFIRAVGSTHIESIFINPHGIGIVLGGTLCAMLVDSSFTGLLGMLRSLALLVAPPSLPTIEEAISELVRLSRRSKAEGGLLALQGESADFAGGFLSRAIEVALRNNTTSEVRQILEEDIRQRRIRWIAEENRFRTMAVLFPMFGLLGTLLGIVGVLKNISDYAKVGPAMALSITTAFYGIAFSNLICVPVAGKLRSRAMREMLLCEVIMEGVVDILSARQPFQVESHLLAYATDRAKAAAEPAPAAARNP